jgi:hypothetical protein
MTRMCTCGKLVRWTEAWACQGCGAPCCPSCAYQPEGTIYCSQCADRAPVWAPAFAILTVVSPETGCGQRWIR